MCTVCGCAAPAPGAGQKSGHEHPHVHDHAHDHDHVHADGTVHRHAHDHGAAHGHGGGHDHAHDHAHPPAAGTLDYGAGPARAHAPGLSQEKMVRIERDILGKNDAYAHGNRRRLAERGIFALNLVSSPGSGKTTLLAETIRRLLPELPITVIEGDQQTAHDAERIRAAGARAVQVNTGKGCHLDASQVEHALAHLDPPAESVLFIENVGNLVCPAAFDLGEAHKVVVLSVTEGEDKPLKYPDMFAAAALMVLNKVDLLPYLSFDTARAIDYARRVNPGIAVLQVSATKGDGFDAWLDWLRAGAAAARARRRDEVAALRRRVADLELTIGRLQAG